MNGKIKTYQDTESFHNGDVTIYVRSAGKKPVYQARIRTPLGTGYIVKSLKTIDRDEGYRRAIDLYEELRFRAKAGEEVKSKSASKVIEEYDFTKVNWNYFCSKINFEYKVDYANRYYLYANI